MHSRAAVEGVPPKSRQSWDLSLQGNRLSLPRTPYDQNGLLQALWWSQNWGLPRGGLGDHFIQTKKILIISFLQIRIALNSIGPIKGTNEDETQLQEVIRWEKGIFSITTDLMASLPSAVKSWPTRSATQSIRLTLPRTPPVLGRWNAKTLRCL